MATPIWTLVRLVIFIVGFAVATLLQVYVQVRIRLSRQSPMGAAADACAVGIGRWTHPSMGARTPEHTDP
jgi:hypothetical protein